MIKRILTGLCTAVLLFSLSVSSMAKPKELSEDVKKGDIVYFGEYEQDGKEKNGKEKIQWRVLNKKEDKVLLISKSILDLKEYDERGGKTSWEKSTLRAWLNKKFFKAAFDEEEREYIIDSKIENKGNKNFKTKGGRNTTDRVFLLSLKEAQTYFKSDESRKAKLTPYAIKRLGKIWGKSQKALWRDHLSEDGGHWLYWLRSPGFDENVAAEINTVGLINDSGEYVSYDTGGVRSVIFWILSYSANSEVNHSIIYRIGTAIEPVTSIFGFRWQTFIAFLSSAVSKESVLGVLNSLYTGTGNIFMTIQGRKLSENLGSILVNRIAPAEALVFIFAVTFNVPCVAAVAATYQETHSMKWTLRIAGYYILMAFILAFLAYRIGLLIF